MKENLDKYLSKNPSSSLAMFRDLDMGQLGYDASPLLREFLSNFDKLSLDHRQDLFRDLEKIIEATNGISSIVGDINNQVGAGQVSTEREERNMLTTLSAAIEFTALKDYYSILVTPPFINEIDKLYSIDSAFAQDMQSVITQLGGVTERLLKQPHSAEDMLLNIIHWPENVNMLADAFGVAPKNINMTNFEVTGNQVTLKGSDRAIELSQIKQLFETTARDHAAHANPMLTNDAEGIKLLTEKGERTRNYMAEKREQLDVCAAESLESSSRLLEKYGIIADAKNVTPQLRDLWSHNASARPLIEKEFQAQAVLASERQKFERDCKSLNKSPEIAGQLELVQKGKSLNSEARRTELEASHSEGIKNLDPKDKKEARAVGGDLSRSGVSNMRNVGNEALVASPTSTPAVGAPQTGVAR